MHTESMPAGWFAAGSRADYWMGIDPETTYGTATAAGIHATTANPAGFATMMQQIKADVFRTKRVRFRGVVQTEDVRESAGLWLRIDGPHDTILAFDNMADRPLFGTIGWSHYAIVVDVPETSVAIAFGILLVGAGRVWLADVDFQTVGHDVATTTPPPLPERPVNLTFTD